MFYYKCKKLLFNFCILYIIFLVPCFSIVVFANIIIGITRLDGCVIDVLDISNRKQTLFLEREN